MAVVKSAPAPRWQPAIIVVVTCTVYLSSLSNTLLWDDQYLIIDNPQIKDWTRVGSLFVSDLFPQVTPSGYYRPLQALTNMIDYHLWGLAPFGYHLTNTFLHAATAALLYLFIGRVLCDWSAATVAALLFAVHPAHTEAVAYVAGRSDPLAAAWMLLALIWFLDDRRSALSWRRVGSLGALVCALLSREAAGILLALLPLVDIAVSRRDGKAIALRRLVARYAPYACVVVGYFVLRAAVVDTAPIPGVPAYTAWWLRLLTMTKVVVQYAALLILPFDLHMERQVAPVTSVLDPLALGATALLGTVGVLAWRVRETMWPIAFATAWFFVALLPVANLWPLATFMAEHWLYVPSMGVFLAVGWAVGRALAGEWRQVVLTGTLLVIAAYGAATVRRTFDWRDEITLYEATVRLAPHSTRAWANLANAYLGEQRTDAARLAYGRAMETMNARPPASQPGDPTSAAARRARGHEQALLGNIYRQTGRHQEAERAFRAALASDPTQASAYNNLGLSLAALGRPEEAQQAFVNAIELYPDFAAAYSNLGNHYFRRDELEPALEAYHAALRLNPEYAEAYNNLGSAYFRRGQLALAEEAYHHALRINPRLGETRRNLAIVAQQRNAEQPGNAPPPR